MGCSDLILPDCDARLGCLMPVSVFKATKYDQNQNLFPVAEIFPCGFQGFLYWLPFKMHTRSLTPPWICS